jgi:hypothetical protein
MRSRRSGKLLSLLLILALTGIAPSLANALRGRVAAEALPPQAVVQATPVDAGIEVGSPGFAPIGEDGTYEFASLSVGTYRLDVIGPGGEALPPAGGVAVMTSVPEEGTVVADLAVEPVGAAGAADGTAPAPAEGAGDPAPPPPSGGGNGNWAAWTAVGIIVAAAIVVVATDKDKKTCEPSASPFIPC